MPRSRVKGAGRATVKDTIAVLGAWTCGLRSVDGGRIIIVGYSKEGGEQI
jgi:hypothetical protein